MATEVIAGAAKRVAMLYRDDADGAIGGGASIDSKLRVVGLNRIRGIFQSDNPAAVGFPRVRFSQDGVNYSDIRVIARDASQPDFAYPFDLKIRSNYAQVQYTQGAVAGTFIRANVDAIAGGAGLEDDSVGSTLGALQFVRSDKDTEFTGAIAIDAHETEDLVGLNSNVGIIESVTLLTEENLAYQVHFWSQDSFDDADLDDDSWQGFVDFSPADGQSISNAVPGTFRYHKKVEIPYQDEDNTQELHVSLSPRGAGATGGAAAEIVLIVAFRAE